MTRPFQTENKGGFLTIKRRSVKVKTDWNDYPNAMREYNYVTKYGITIADYDQIFNSQGGVCAICKEPPSEKRRLAVDHNHQTGKVRGLLCYQCNVQLGTLENPPWLIKACEYLEKYKDTP